MDFEYSSEQKLLWESVRKLMQRVATPDYLRRLDRERLYPYELYDAWVEAGLLLCPFRRNMAASAAASSTLRSSPRKSAAERRRGYGLRRQYLLQPQCRSVKARKSKSSYWLPKLISGEIRMSISMSEPDAGSDVGAMRTQARRDGNDYVISGQKIWATGAGAETTSSTSM